MSLIEQAAKRLEELRARARICRSRVRRSHRAPIGATDARSDGAGARAAGRMASPRACFAANGSSEAARRPRRSPTSAHYVEIDLDKLQGARIRHARCAASQIADEFRVDQAADHPQRARPAARGSARQPRHGDERAAGRRQDVHVAQPRDEHRDGDRQHACCWSTATSRIRRSPRCSARRTSPGLLDLLTRDDLDVADALVKTNIEKLTLLPAGSRHRRSTELLASEQMASLLRELASRYRRPHHHFRFAAAARDDRSARAGDAHGSDRHGGGGRHDVAARRQPGAGDDRELRIVLMVLNKASRTDVGTYYGYYADRRGELARTSLDAHVEILRAGHCLGPKPRRRVSRRPSSPRLTLAVLGAAVDIRMHRRGESTPSFTFESTLTDNVNLAPNDRRQRPTWSTQITPALAILLARARASQSRGQCLAADTAVCAHRRREQLRVADGRHRAAMPSSSRSSCSSTARPTCRSSTSTPFGAAAQQPRERDQQPLHGAVYTRQPVPARLAGQQSRVRAARQQHLDRSGNGVGSIERRCVRQFRSPAISTRQPTPLGWSLSTTTGPTLQFQNQPSERLQIARASALYRADPALELSATVGYESNELPLTTESGVDLWRGGNWHPTDRTNVDAKWEHRFFGASYNVAVRPSDAAFGLVVSCVAQHHQLSAAARRAAGWRRCSRISEFAAAVEGSRSDAAPVAGRSDHSRARASGDADRARNVADAAGHARRTGDGDVRHPGRAQQHFIQRLSQSPGAGRRRGAQCRSTESW